MSSPVRSRAVARPAPVSVCLTNQRGIAERLVTSPQCRPRCRPARRPAHASRWPPRPASSSPPRRHVLGGEWVSLAQRRWPGRSSVRARADPRPQRPQRTGTPAAIAHGGGSACLLIRPTWPISASNRPAITAIPAATLIAGTPARRASDSSTPVQSPSGGSGNTTWAVSQPDRWVPRFHGGPFLS